MVVFTCNNCGECLQKPKVAKHFQFHSRCTPIFLTCVDCHKDFRGDEYVKHTKCITENERYGGKGFQLKASANKGERKQQEWINVVQNLLNSSTDLSAPERNILNTLSRHENIPRKKAKFLNFIRSVFGNRVNMTVIESLWTKMEESFKESTPNNQLSENDSNPKNGKAEQPEDNVSENQNNENAVKENGNSAKHNESEKEGKKKKSKKRALQTTETQDVEEEEENEKMIKKRLKTDLKETIDKIDKSQEEETTKFSWKNTIIEIVSTKGEMSMKKLRKKVIARYMEHSNNSNSEKATLKFDKKIKKVSEISINDEKVTLT
ncbi:cell growth-regulating nucleolar protein [Leptopilina heterotoma]|uniref:cell growth-regulating nucleolar protein n=1 Tax=Leptopilina heterotoma TaxID=63436 RepID=UPI001CA9B5B4|nr:cell growth-regulating nucleolar protein [Leptopilina heterotoma]